jgi:sugar transferase (PEP-CTERM/EpsH1 system associated)
MECPEKQLTVAHIIFRFSTGGLENGLVNLVNNLDEGRYRHLIICLSDYDLNFADRIRTSNTELFRLQKRPGNDFRMLYRLYKLLKRLRPDVLHTRNFGTLEAQAIGFVLQIPLRIHGEHGWDVDDLTGERLRSRLVRRVVGNMVHKFVTVSQHLQQYLTETANIPTAKVIHIYNGVDTELFSPAAKSARKPIVIGTVGRMQLVKNQPLLVRAFVNLMQRHPSLKNTLRLRLVGDGPLLQTCTEILRAASMLDRADLVGPSNEVPAELRSIDIFVLPSLAEGISNTILEAMATGLPVIATGVGGNCELVVDGKTGAIVPSDDPEPMVDRLWLYVENSELRKEHGKAARRRVEQGFGLDTMVANYDRLYSNAQGSWRVSC